MRTVVAFLLVAVSSVSSGCSLCAPGYLCDYAGVGGKWQRTDPENGRVGSIFSDPNSVVGASAQVTNEEPYEYEEVVPREDSVLEPASTESVVGEPVATEAGVIILGDQW